ncbi:hypothetical protein [Nocardiopsis sp. RV163]|uniref:hypothetical protein n=1 Tax=Nocardiopsis sp. RV163 TaxID=1661388 RepID=UPI00064C0DBC|nr:hypothetical protein [Nocardiopsis sp. RV163]
MPGKAVPAVFQDFGRCESTVRDNIAFGSLAHADDEEGLREAAGRAAAHRFTTARAADLIVVTDGGRAVETGTHDTLSRADGLYAEVRRKRAESDGAARSPRRCALPASSARRLFALSVDEADSSCGAPRPRS